MSEYNGVLYCAPPPAGVVPDWNKAYQATNLIAVICVFLPLATIAMIIRIFTRTRIVRQFAADDYLMIAAMVLSIILCALIFDLLNYGLGKNLYNVPLDMLYPNFLKVNVVAAIIFCAATGLAKTSILLFYRRIFPSRKFHYAVWVLVVYTAGFSAASVFVNIFSCSPVAGSWDIAYATTAKCINRPVFYFAQAGLGILADFATVIAPLPVMYNLQMPLRQKIGIAGILTLGGFVCVVSIIRLQSLYVLLKGKDLTVDTVNALLWCVIELNVSIAAGCAPTLRPFLRKYFPAILGTTGLYGSNSARRGTHQQNHSHPLQSFDRAGGFSATAKSSVARTTTTKLENESEEYIIQQDDSKVGSVRGEGGDAKEGQIKMTVEYGFEDYMEQAAKSGRSG